MKVTVENKKGLNKDFKVLVDKKTMNSYLDNKYEEIKNNVVLKGFRPGKAPKEILKKQFGQAIMGEVIDKVLKDTSQKVLEDNKIKPAGQPKIDLKSFGEDKDLEYVISVTELPKIDIKSIENITFDEYEVKIDENETDKRIKEIAKSQKNFVEVDPAKIANEGDLVIFDYKATVDGNEFKGSEGKNTQLEIGKDLFIKGFDKQLLKVKKGEKTNVEVTLPENFPEKELANKKAKFICNITAVKKSKPVNIDDDFAKTLGAKDLNDLKNLITKQINNEFKNSLEILSNKKILNQIEKIKVDEIPENLIEQEVSILSQGMKEEEIKKNKKNFEISAKKRIKTGLILNEFGEQNQIKVSEQEMQNEIQKQLKMMPGQEKIVKEYYEKNPSLLNNLKGSLYEDKIMRAIKNIAKANKKKISKKDAEKLLKEENEKNLKDQTEHSSHDHSHEHSYQKKENIVDKSSPSKKALTDKNAESTTKKTNKTKKVSKK